MPPWAQNGVVPAVIIFMFLAGKRQVGKGFAPGGCSPGGGEGSEQPSLHLRQRSSLSSRAQGSGHEVTVSSSVLPPPDPSSGPSSASAEMEQLLSRRHRGLCSVEGRQAELERVCHGVWRCQRLEGAVQGPGRVCGLSLSERSRCGRRGRCLSLSRSAAGAWIPAAGA